LKVRVHPRPLCPPVWTIVCCGWLLVHVKPLPLQQLLLNTWRPASKHECRHDKGCPASAPLTTPAVKTHLHIIASLLPSPLPHTPLSKHDSWHCKVATHTPGAPVQWVTQYCTADRHYLRLTVLLLPCCHIDPRCHPGVSLCTDAGVGHTQQQHLALLLLWSLTSCTLLPTAQAPRPRLCCCSAAAQLLLSSA
jgi:hypothetical protein